MQLRARSWVVGIVILVCAAATHAAPASRHFDLMRYVAPKGWKARTQQGVLRFEIIDRKKGTFGAIVVSPSTPSAGTLDRDFQAAWERVIVPGFQVSDPPQLAPNQAENGWEARTGSARGSLDGAAAMVVLVTMTGHGRTTNIVVATNSDAYASAIDGFLTSIKMDVPAAPPAPAPPAPPASHGPTTTFSDGWTATAEASWVRVTRAGATVRLHHGVALDDASRRDPVDFFWRTLLLPRYAVSNLARPAYSPVNFPYYVAQADATDRATGTGGYLTLRIVIANGVARCIEVFVPSRAAFESLFPDQDKLAQILGANRFALGKELAGTWTSSNGAAIDMYYAGTGNYAGMNASVAADTFVFAPDGTYSSEHKGASGMVGSQKVYQTRDRGTYAIAPWEVTLRQSDGATRTYSAYYEAVKGGMVLHLQNTTYSGMTYALVRTR